MDVEPAIDAGTVDAIIASKTQRGEFMASPDAPSDEGARWYFMYDGTTWENSSSRESEHDLRGKANLRAEDPRGINDR